MDPIDIIPFLNLLTLNPATNIQQGLIVLGYFFEVWFGFEVLSNCFAVLL